MGRPRKDGTPAAKPGTTNGAVRTPKTLKLSAQDKTLLIASLDASLINAEKIANDEGQEASLRAFAKAASVGVGQLIARVREVEARG